MSSAPTFVLPDLASYCDFKFQQNPYYQSVSPQSEAWMETFSTMRNDRSRQAYYAARFSLLTAYCFPEANAERYRLCCDYIAALFAFDDVADEGDLQDNVQGMKAAIDITMHGLRDPHGTPPTKFVPAEMMRSFWGRAIQIATPGCADRFVQTMEHYTQAVYQQVANRSYDEDLDLVAFIEMRRDLSAMRPVWALCEFSLGIDLPNSVMEHPSILKLSELANDVVSWTNDLYSFNNEQSFGQTTNLVIAAGKEYSIDLQASIDFVGNLVDLTIKQFKTTKAELPSWSPEIDAQVDAYLMGMEYWMIGTIEWSFASKRYFGEQHEVIKCSRVVTLYPRKDTALPSLIASH